ncbi:hypothetical protein GMDG_08669 [Pseudogymnoascus destructans 20631-21]|uniref:Uncharacterized protein n=1 Tax=Pseudogymnoascus destructans (strain ATCC MYA-4855 / 20631-21) TaxID=658429 RepID=L8G7U4_PSED2|nr:hypothetical protein GMDG_08669 [Pseudogymnoascus destructans 20631-21]
MITMEANPHGIQKTAWPAIQMASQLSEPIRESIESPSLGLDQFSLPLTWEDNNDAAISTTTSTASSITRSSQNCMTAEDMLFVMRLCIEQQAAYGHQSD